MTDLKYLEKKVALRWWWFDLDLRRRRTFLRDIVSGVVVVAVGFFLAWAVFLAGLSALR